MGLGGDKFLQTLEDLGKRDKTFSELAEVFTAVATEAAKVEDPAVKARLEVLAAQGQGKLELLKRL